MFECSIKNISLTSTNRKFKTHPKYLNAKAHLTELFKVAQGKTPPMEEPVEIDLILKTSKDVDNLDKLIHDALESAGVFKNDSQIIQRSTWIVRADRGSKESLIIKVRPASMLTLTSIGGMIKLCDQIPEPTPWENYE